MRSVPVLNHVALTVDASLLEGPKREALKDFYGAVFGWEESPQMTIDGERLVFRLYRRGQFLQLVSGAQPRVAGERDHFGIEVGSKATLEEMIARAREFKEKRDPSVEINDIKLSRDTENLRLWEARVRYLLPMMVEIQCFEDKT
ncbi:MAG: VOC family protein [Dehalococcoidia bacterium]